MLLETPICDVGTFAPEFTLKDPDGKSYSLEDVMGKKGLLVAFICNHCPYVQGNIKNMVADFKSLQEYGIGVVAIMSNNYQTHPDDSPENMKEFAVEHGMTFPYLVDESQEVAKAYGAVCTPDYFGYNANRELQYRGRLDDAKMGGVGERKPELLEAMQQVAATGEGPKEQIPSMGCSIKWK